MTLQTKYPDPPNSGNSRVEKLEIDIGGTSVFGAFAATFGCGVGGHVAVFALDRQVRQNVSWNKVATIKNLNSWLKVC